MKLPPRLSTFFILAQAVVSFTALAEPEKNVRPHSQEPGTTLITVYSAPSESDFGKVATESAEWSLPDSDVIHVSKFVPGFTGRDSVDPKHSNLSGVAMEGSGWIDQSLHKNDAQLMKRFKQGYKALNLDTWDEVHHKAVFTLSKYPTSSLHTPLVPGVTAAVKANNKLFPMGRWVKLEKRGRFMGYRRIEDDCSSCEENQLDLYETQEKSNGEGDQQMKVTLMPKEFRP